MFFLTRDINGNDFQGTMLYDECVVLLYIGVFEDITKCMKNIQMCVKLTLLCKIRKVCVKITPYCV